MSVERCVHGCVAVIPLLCLSLGITAVRAGWSLPDTTTETSRTAPPSGLLDGVTSPDGRYIALADASGIVLWNVEAATYLPISDAPVTHLALGDHLLVGAGVDGAVHQWRLDTGEKLGRLPAGPTALARVAIDDQGHIAAGDVSGGVFVWDATGGLLLSSRLGTSITDVALSEDLVYVRGSGRCRVLELSSGAPVDALDGSVGRAPSQSFRCAAATSADGLDLG